MLWKIIKDRTQYLLKQGSSTSQMTAAKIHVNDKQQMQHPLVSSHNGRRINIIKNSKDRRQIFGYDYRMKKLQFEKILLEHTWEQILNWEC